MICVRCSARSLQNPCLRQADSRVYRGCICTVYADIDDYMTQRSLVCDQA